MPEQMEKMEEMRGKVETALKNLAIVYAEYEREGKAQRTEIDETEDSYRIRQKDPGQFDDESFRTIEVTEGVKGVVGCPKGEYSQGKCQVGTQIQTYIFDKGKFTKDQARNWIKENVEAEAAPPESEQKPIQDTLNRRVAKATRKDLSLIHI